MIQNEKSDWLFDFIKSLEQNEKRYFKVQSAPQGSENKKYFQLFDAYDSLTRWNDEKLRNKIKDQSILKFLPQEKRSLYNALLKSLRAYYSDSNLAHKTTSHLEDYEILMKKNNFVLAKKSLAKAKLQSEEYENFSDLIKIYSLEIEHSRSEYRNEDSKKKTTDIFKNIEEATKKLLNYLEYEKAYAHVVRMNKKIELVSSLNEVYEIKKILSQPIFANEARALSVRSKVLYNYVFGVYHYFVNEYSRSEEYFSRYLKLFEANPKIKEIQFENYIRALKNYLFIKLKLGKTDEFLDSFQKLSTLKSNNQFHSDNVYYSTYMFVIIFNVQTGKYREAIDYIQEEKQRFNEISRRVESKHILFEESVFIRFRSAFAYLCLGEPEKAIEQINMYLENEKSKKLSDSYTIANIVLCILYYESGNRLKLWETIKYLLKILKEKPRLNEFERTAYRFMNKAVEVGIKNKWKKEFEVLIKELEPIKQKKFEQNVFEYFAYDAWLEGKVKGKSINNIMLGRLQ
ncbi:MAG: hypothetical protein JXR58_11440 [Bacteroidales bacterium]|nr:hypothetical protein [Bacteroidales bacterium]